MNLLMCMWEVLIDKAPYSKTALEEKKKEMKKLLTYFPSECVYEFDFEKSNSNYLVIKFSYSHEDDDGKIIKWTDHVLEIKPSLLHGYELKISNIDELDPDEMYNDYFDDALNGPVYGTNFKGETIILV